jgi:hypothetical protein
VRIALPALACLLALACSSPASDPATDADASLDVAADTPTDPTPDPTPDAPLVPTVTLKGDAFRDRLAGGWVGQMVGVVRAGLTEFQYLGEIIPEEYVPVWDAAAFWTAYMQDDLYVEIPFLEVFHADGPFAGWKALGAAFAGTEFPLWHANKAGRDNLLAGIPAPDSGHYSRNPHADDIDWQIEADFLGLAAPGLPGAAAAMAWRVGHVMNYGDGVYGGVWAAAMKAEAFVADDLEQVIDAGLAVVPSASLFRQVLEDVIAWHASDPVDWQATWQKLQDKWRETDRCPDGAGVPYNIDSKLNAAYVLIGLLYGGGDFEKSMVIAMRCGDDSDCTTSTVGGTLGALYGLSGIPEVYKTDLVMDQAFTWTERTLADCLAMEEDLARQVVTLAGGSIAGAGSEETWTIPRPETVPLVLEQWPEYANDAPVILEILAPVNAATRAAEFRMTATDADGVADVQWFFHDLSYDSGSEVTHVYPGPGTYDVHVWVADTSGNTSWMSLKVAID